MRIAKKYIFVLHAAVFVGGLIIGAVAFIDTYEEPIEYPKKLKVYQGGKK